MNILSNVERLWKLCFVAVVECNHQHGIMFQHPPLYCVHLIPWQGFCARIATTIVCVFGWSYWCWQTPRKKYRHLGSFDYNVDDTFVRFSCCNPLHMGIFQHEYLNFHVENTNLSHYLIEGFPNHNCVVTSSHCVSQQSTIYIVFYLLLHP